MDLKGKKVLFIGIGFYDYEDAIKKMLKKYGADVCYVNSCHRDNIIRAYNRLGWQKQITIRLQRIRTKKLESANTNNDIVFIIKGESLKQCDIDLLRRLNPKANFIVYLWDSLVRLDNRDLLLSNFDTIWSFDRLDCINNPQLKFRPLFYRTVPPKELKQFMLSFIGWMHSDRLTILRSLRDKLRVNKESYCFRLYMGKFNYFISRYLTRKICKTDEELITLKPIPYSEFQHITASSFAVLDIAHPMQSGLTIRTIESLASGCHLLTTNSDIKNYAEIPTACYTVFSRENPILPKMEQRENIIMLNEYFSLDGFIKELFA